MIKRSLERQIKYLSEKERRGRAEKLAAFEKDAMSKHKKKICIDENLSGVIEPMKDIGYNVFEFEKGIKDEDLDKLMREKNVQYFFTKNYLHFINLVKADGYKMFKISINRTNDKMADVFDWLIMHYKEFKAKGKDIHLPVIDKDTLISYGCHL